MSLRHAASEAFFQRFEAALLGSSFREECRVKVCRRVPMTPANDDEITIGIPLQK
jgi:hypothetical protein